MGRQEAIESSRLQRTETQGPALAALEVEAKITLNMSDCLCKQIEKNRFLRLVGTDADSRFPCVCFVSKNSDLSRWVLRRNRDNTVLQIEP